MLEPLLLPPLRKLPNEGLGEKEGPGEPEEGEECRKSSIYRFSKKTENSNFKSHSKQTYEYKLYLYS